MPMRLHRQSKTKLKPTNAGNSQSMIALRSRDSQTNLICLPRKAFRLSFLRRCSLSRSVTALRKLDRKAILLIHRASITKSVYHKHFRVSIGFLWKTCNFPLSKCIIREKNPTVDTVMAFVMQRLIYFKYEWEKPAPMIDKSIYIPMKCGL